MEEPQRCAVIGLGEAGRRYAEALIDSGHSVAGFDPGPVESPAGLRRASSPGEAVNGASFVFVLSAAAAAKSIAESTVGFLSPQTVYCDLTSSSPAAMASIAQIIAKSGALFADVAILGPVTVAGARTPVLISGEGAASASSVFTAFGAAVDVIDGPPGAAMSHKLLRSVFMKGLASIVCEAVDAGRRAGAEKWVRHQIAQQLAGDGEAVIDRFLTGTVKHAGRRADEMEAASDYLEALGVPHEMTSATTAALGRLTGQSDAGNHHQEQVLGAQHGTA